ncbi:MAG: hypothetical protein BWX47_02091 [candidate division Hyd24-12 bacterium ADurb.Bin004]|nr:MAG: hypothetical protein BWX47_02091 [candidate division Hyd24-12 bacterium ADurb.Bin004]
MAAMETGMTTPSRSREVVSPPGASTTSSGLEGLRQRMEPAGPSDTSMVPPGRVSGVRRVEARNSRAASAHNREPPADLRTPLYEPVRIHARG